MEIKEAIERLKQYHDNSVIFSETVGEEKDYFTVALEIAISALEKQTGKKAKKEPLDYCYFCPTCNKYFGGTFDGEWRTGKPYYHCPECGQKIDWEATE